MDIGDIEGRSTRKKAIIIGTVMILLLLTVWLIIEFYQPFRSRPLILDSAGQGNSDMPSRFSDIKVPVTLFYPAGKGLAKEEKTVAAGSLPVKMVESVLREYFDGFKTDLKNTVVRGVYRDKNRVYYIDLSDEFRRGVAGDAMDEYYLLKSLHQTVVTNVSEVRDIRLLIEGREVESLGGHIMTQGPLQETLSF
jgi:hypothetical protein